MRECLYPTLGKGQVYASSPFGPTIPIGSAHICKEWITPSCPANTHTVSLLADDDPAGVIMILKEMQSLKCAY